MKLWEERPYLAGKSGTGYGMVKLDYNMDDKDDSKYLEYLSENKEEITAFLDGLVKQWK